MYGDIIPPSKKKYSDTRAESRDHDQTVHFSRMQRSQYAERKNRKTPVLLTLLAVLVFGLIVYHKVYSGTTLTVTPKVTRIEIRENIPLILQSREKDALTYSLVYVPDRSLNDSDEVRNPFAKTAATTSVATSTEASAQQSGLASMTATSTKDTKRIQLINTSNQSVTLRIATRLAVGTSTTVYTLDAAGDVKPTSASAITAIASSTPKYKVMGFVGSALYDQVYAVAADAVVSTNASANTREASSESTSTIPPPDVLALMPDDAIPLIKSTIYDKVLEQSAVVVFDSRTLEDFLQSDNVQAQDYFKVLKPFGGSVTYKIAVVDYTLITSPDTGKPVSLSSLILEITPVLDDALLPGQFAGFGKDTMEKIEKQVAEFVDLKVSYVPFWANAVATEDRIKVRTN
jgi:hypothetical protein